MAPHENSSKSLTSLASWALTGTYMVICLIGLLRHEPWRDELQVWQVARASNSIGELFGHMNTEGHPSLWFLLNFILTRFTGDPLFMQLLHGLIAATGIYFFFRHAPFGWLPKVLFGFGYYALFEYGMISRNYALAFTFLMIFCSLYARQPRQYALLSLLLLLMANSTFYGAIMAACLGLLLYGELFFRWRKKEAIAWRHALPGLLIWLAGVCAAVGHVLYQSQHIGPTFTYEPAFDRLWLIGSLSVFYKGFVPLQDFTSPHFWNTNILRLAPSPTNDWIAFGISLSIFTATIIAFVRKPVILIVYLMGCLAMLYLILFKHAGYVRHHGQFFLWFLACLWLSRLAGKGWFGETAGKGTAGGINWQTVFLTVFLGLQLVAGAYAYVIDLQRPFSMSKAVGAYLNQAEFRHLPKVGQIDFTAQPITAYIDQPMWFPQQKKFGTFINWGYIRRPVSNEQAIRDAIQLMQQNGTPVILVMYRRGFVQNYPGSVFLLDQHTQVQVLAAFQGAIVSDENYFIYMLLRPTVP